MGVNHEDRDEKRVTDRPADGPARGEPGRGDDLGGSSQGEPGADAADRSSGGGAERPEPDAAPPADSNEGADGRAEVVEPGGGESPRPD